MLESGRSEIPLDLPRPVPAPSVCVSLFSVSYYYFPELSAFIYSGSDGGTCMPPRRNVLFIGRQKNT